MKRKIATVSLLLTFNIAAFASIITAINTPQDNPEARQDIWERTELKSLHDEYSDFIQTRIWPMKSNEVRKVFGSKLAREPDECVLPLFGPMMISIGGFTQTPDRRHNDFHAIGNIGYIEVFYNTDGESIGNAVFYLRPDDKFVPLQSTNDFARRIKWDEAKFRMLKNWLSQHLPKATDLGIVEVSDAVASQIDIGGGKVCVVQTHALNYSPEFLAHVPQAATNDYFSVHLYLDSANSAGHLKDLGGRVSPKSMSFVVDGQFYLLTIKHKTNLPKTTAQTPAP